jgi:hypothetical protein
MTLQAQKLEIVQLLLETNDKEVLQKVKTALSRKRTRKPPAKKVNDETAYLLSNPANRKVLEKGISQLKKGQKTAIKTADLWK